MHACNRCSWSPELQAAVEVRTGSSPDWIAAVEESLGCEGIRHGFSDSHVNGNFGECFQWQEGTVHTISCARLLNAHPGGCMYPCYFGNTRLRSRLALSLLCIMVALPVATAIWFRGQLQDIVRSRHALGNTIWRLTLRARALYEEDPEVLVAYCRWREEWTLWLCEQISGVPVMVILFAYGMYELFWNEKLWRSDTPACQHGRQLAESELWEVLAIVSVALAFRVHPVLSLRNRYYPARPSNFVGFSIDFGELFWKVSGV